MSNNIEYPITVTSIEWAEHAPYFNGYYGADDIGRLCSVRPVKSIDPEEKTYLGLYLGELRVMGKGWSFNAETGKLTEWPPRPNPAIFVFDLQRIVFGYESWWGIIESAEQLRQITDDDIKNIWYVKAMQQLQERREAEAESAPA